MSLSPGIDALYAQPLFDVATLVGAGAAELLLAADVAELDEPAAPLGVAEPDALVDALPLSVPPAGVRAAGFCELEHPASSRQAPNAPMRPLYTLPRISTILAFPLVSPLRRPL
jgi:hypothetical protein